jgi:recombinational DNA repair ATPase RecF
VTIRDELFEWLSARPDWQQDLARRLASNPQLEGDALDEALAVVLGSFGALAEGQTASTPSRLQLNDLPTASEGATGSPRLVSFGHLRGLGAAAEDQELRFAETGITAVYGPNAAGKTTYVRGLKRVCRTVDRDSAVRGNVFRQPEPGTPGPSATVEYVASGERRAQQIQLANPADLGLGTVSVFDSRCAELYVDSRNAVAYVPSALLLLARLAATQDQTRARVTAEISRLEAQRPTFPELEQATIAQTRVSRLAATTDLEELRQFAELGEEDRSRQLELRSIIAAAGTKSARADAQAAQEDGTQVNELVARIRDVAARVASPAVATLRVTAEEAERTRKALDVANREFDGLPVSGVGGEHWQRLWRAAFEFNEQRGVPFPPTEGAHCPLCLRQIDHDTAARMAHFEEHIRSTLQAEADAAQRAITEALMRLEAGELAACRAPFLAGLKEREPELHEEIERYLKAVADQMQSLRENPINTDAMPISGHPLSRLETWGRGRAEHAAALLAAEDPEHEARLRSELAELDGRNVLSSRLDDITLWIATLKRVARLRDAHSGLATNRITSKQREMSDALVTETLSGRLVAELRNLGCEHVAVELQPHTAVGETQVVLRLAGAHGTPPVSEILSEGEQRALSLAFFFAEVGSSEHDGGIIVDDPVSSLDDERRAYIAKRLVEESGRRQVIVLTHDLAFLLDLSDHAEAIGASPMLQGMWRFGDEVGRVDDRPPFTAMKLRARIGVLDQEVAQWDNQPPPRNFDEAWRRVCDSYDQMRKTWERAIEERLFRGVVQRLQREVKTLALKDVVITPELISAVTEGMTRCSHFVHDAPPGTGGNLPNRQQLAADLEKLKDFERATRA